MFYKMITNKRDKWYSSSECKVKEIIDYMVVQNQMRDAQIEAIKTYLFLKIACENKPLYKLFAEGAFNCMCIDEIELSTHARSFLNENPAAVALLEYSMLKNDLGEQVSEKLTIIIKKQPELIDYIMLFKKMFYEVSYTDYLFSLPMGAGKTYLMAAFIYLDLYFAINEPDNKVFAHNFIVFAPSGLKSSVVPSLRTIQSFDPTWIIPNPSATIIKRMIKFEVLDQSKSAKKSNRTKNPNVQKIAFYQPLHELMGLVTVTNAEKVILDRIIEKDGQISFLDESDDEKDKAANELRNLLGKLPNVSIVIDEVHHAVSEEIKLRAVVSKWAKNDTVNSVIGFSGTPYLEKAEKIAISDALTIAGAEINNIVYYYPLINGISNFLKRPVVKISNNENSLEIVEAGLRLFLDKYKDTKYKGGLFSKLGIYCGSIEKLEAHIYPLVSQVVSEYGLNPVESVLKFHKGNKNYPIPVDSQLQFDTLDKSISKIRIILLVQIGKEGWDCKSLTGIVLSQEGDCPKNMVLQTACRCLRQVEKNIHETAIIYLNESNANKLNMQLRQQHHITIKDLENANYGINTTIKRYDRTEYLKLPKVDFYQLKVNYKTLVVDAAVEPKTEIFNAVKPETIVNTIVKTQDFNQMVREISTNTYESGRVIANFNIWLYLIVKESYSFISMSMLLEHESVLKVVYDKITYERNGHRFFSSKYKINMINENIRKAFYEKRKFESYEELIPHEACLLNITNFQDKVYTTKPENFYPDEALTEKIIMDDKGKLKTDKKTQRLLELAEESGQTVIAEQIRKQQTSHPMKDKSFHYLPYKTDSTFEQTFLAEVLNLTCVKEKELEVYYNGDRALTEFKIKCFKSKNRKWLYIGMYTPDFLIISRKNNQIHKAIIVETKGKIYANDPTFKDKRVFVETYFKIKNNIKFGFERFDYLYLEDSMTEIERITETAEVIERFFKEDK